MKIDVFLHDKCLLKTGGQLKLTGAHSARFEHAGIIHEVTLTWGLAGLRSFPIEVVDGQTKVTIHLLFPTAEARNMVVEKYGAIEADSKHWLAWPGISPKYNQGENHAKNRFVCACVTRWFCCLHR